jgi:glycosyltransferase involved in cell wall biosynthesis
LDIVTGLRRLVLLRELPVSSSGSLVSIIVAGRDEERGIEAALRSLLKQKHANLEVIAIDDRSTDQTGAILDRLAGEDSRLRVIHVQELPERWLGKNHALWLGARQAKGSWLLFTDADVIMEPEAITRALGYAEREGFGHLTVLPETIVPGFWLQVFVTAFSVWGMAASRPWVVKQPGNRRYLGIGAFNLVQAECYAKAGGHEKIRLRPDDDLKLGKILKRSGARTDVLRARGAVRVEWYRSLGEAIDGLMKNSFSVIEYRLSFALGGALCYLIVALGPFMAMGFGGTTTRLLGVGTLLAELGTAFAVSRDIPTPRRSALLFPVGCLILCWVLLRATFTTLAAGGIRWRGTFYGLRELKRNRV